MRRLSILGLAGGVLAAGLGGCADDSAPPSSAASPEPSARASGVEARSTRRTAERRTGATVTVRRTRYGTVLADGRGRILYEFTRDGQRGRSRCYGDCAVAWPPLFTRGAPRARGAADPDLLGTTRRRDGRLQVTYRGKPLYFYVTDTRPGQVTCQAVPEFGGTWYVTNPDGSTNRAPR